MSSRVLAVLVSILLCSLSGAQDKGLALNFADAANMGTMGLSASYAVQRHWTAGASVKYNPFTYGRGTERETYSRQRSASVVARYWPWHVYSGWWAESRLRLQEYSDGSMPRMKSEDGLRYGVGAAAGYSLMLGKHLDLEVGYGVWAGREEYRAYECPRCGRLVDEGSRFFMAASDIMLGLALVF